jgi:hypothetical protein
MEGKEGGREGGGEGRFVLLHKHTNRDRRLPKTAFMASSLVQVMTSCRQEEGRREFLCFFNRWRTWTLGGRGGREGGREGGRARKGKTRQWGYDTAEDISSE